MRHKEFDSNEFCDVPLRGKTSAVSQFGWDAIDRPGRKRLNISRWLQSHIGEKFSDVYSKFVKLKKDRGACHWYDDLKNHWWITLDCRLENGKFYDTKDEEVIDGFAVVDDILYKVGQRRRHWRPPPDEDRRLTYGVVWKDGKVFASIKDVWYELILAKSNISFRNKWGMGIFDDHDIFLEPKTNFGTESSLRKLLYGGSDLYCKAKRQLCKQEIKRLKLRTLFNSGEATSERSD
jgi:hypothetical protein